MSMYDHTFFVLLRPLFFWIFLVMRCKCQMRSFSLLKFMNFLARTVPSGVMAHITASLLRPRSTPTAIRGSFESVTFSSKENTRYSYKTVSSRLLRKEFPDEVFRFYVNSAFWSQSYFICTVSERSEAAVKHYIETQKRRLTPPEDQKGSAPPL